MGRASRITKRGPVDPEFNMTPLIDVTFLLIIFFMLVNNIIADQEVEMLVPELDNSQVQEVDEKNQVVINLVPGFEQNSNERMDMDNAMQVSGYADKVRIGSQTFSMLESLDPLANYLRDIKKAKPEIDIVLRADAATEYQYVQPVMEAITLAGISRVNMQAYLPDEGPQLFVDQ
jgi:biopolymer transport protein ExbD